MDVFVSVGTGLNTRQEIFVGAVEARLRSIGFNPQSIGRTAFSTDAPLRAVTTLMDRCEGAVIIALERFFFASGVERRGSDREAPLAASSMPTAWNQIEAAIAYGRNLPLLVLVDEDLRCDGLLEKGNDWFVLELPVDPAALNGPTFAGLLEDWRAKVVKRPATARRSLATEIDKMTVAQLAGSLKPTQLWSLIVAAAGVIGGAFALGVRLGG